MNLPGVLRFVGSNDGEKIIPFQEQARGLVTGHALLSAKKNNVNRGLT
jgi:hypothetical protein